MPPLGVLLCIVAVGIVAGALWCLVDGSMLAQEQRYRRVDRGDD